MTSFLIVTRDKQKRLQYVRDYCAKGDIKAFDCTIIERETAIKQNAQSIGIEEIKKMQKILFLKPIQSPLKAIIIEEAHLLTLEAQNALLKVLEEPPAHTLIFLTADNSDAILPTIHSRCTIFKLENDHEALGEKECAEITEFIQTISEMSIPQRLKIAEKKSKEKEKVLLWIEEVIRMQRDMLLKEPDDYAGILTLRELQQLYTLIKTTNVNPRMAMETTLLRL